MQQFKAIAFDLDDTLIDTSARLVPQARKAALAAMIEKGLKAEVSQLDDLVRSYLRAETEDFFEHTLSRFQVSAEKRAPLIEAARDAFYKREIPTDLECFAGVPELLVSLQKRYALYLVTAGDPVTQLKKINILGIHSYFTSHFCVDSFRGETKGEAFQRIIEREAIEPHELLSVGNRLDSEIEDAKKLGALTCLMNHGEYAHLKPLNEWQKPDYEISRITDLIPTCQLL